MAFNTSNHLQPCRLPKLDDRGALVGGHAYKWPSSPPTNCGHCRLPKLDARRASVGHDYKWPSTPPTTRSRAGYSSWTLEESQLGFMTTNGLRHIQPLATVPLMQAGRQRSVSWGSRLQMAFQSSNHLQPCWLPKLDARGASIEGHVHKWPSSPPVTCNGPVTQVGRWRSANWGHNYIWPPSPPTTYSRAGYPSWTREEHRLGVVTIDGLQMILRGVVKPPRAPQVRP